MRMNERMASLPRSLATDYQHLPSELRALLDEGWCVGPAGSLLLKGLYGEHSGSDWLSEDVAKHEYEVNDVWIPTSDLQEERGHFLEGAASRAFGFVILALQSARPLKASSSLVAVISIGFDEDYLTSGTTVKLFTHRGSYPRYFDNLERFQLEAMAIVEVSDLNQPTLRGIGP